MLCPQHARFMFKSMAFSYQKKKIYIYTEYFLMCHQRDRQTHREHLEELEAVGGPAFLGFVDGKWQLHVASVLRKQQHQKDRPGEEKTHTHTHS